jgi:hypothetical protein
VSNVVTNGGFNMLKRIGLVSAAVLSLAAGASQAGAQSGSIAYLIYFYDDAAHTNQVGIGRPQCRDGNITYLISGTSTIYHDDVPSYYCGPDGPEPL